MHSLGPSSISGHTLFGPIRINDTLQQEAILCILCNCVIGYATLISGTFEWADFPMGCVLILFSFDANTQEEEKLNLDHYLALAQIF